MQPSRHIRAAVVAGSLSFLFLLQGCGGASEAAEEPKSPPSVVATVPANGAVNVAPGAATVSVTFNQPMQAGWSFVVSPYGEAPKIGKPSLSSDRRTISASVELEPGKTYALWLNSPSHRNFMSAKRRPAAPYHY